MGMSKRADATSCSEYFRSCEYSIPAAIAKKNIPAHDTMRLRIRLDFTDMILFLRLPPMIAVRKSESKWKRRSNKTGGINSTICLTFGKFCYILRRIKNKDIDMPNVCQVTGKKTEVGMNVSHSHRRTKRTFKPNMQSLKFHSDILGRDFSLKLTSSGLRTLVKHGGLDNYVTAKPVSRLVPEMAAIKKAIEKKVGASKAPEKKPARKPNISARLAKKVAAKK